MAIFKTRDYSAAKSDENREAIGLKLGLGVGVQATNAQVDAQIEQWLREQRQILKRAKYEAAFVADSPDA